MLSEHFAAGPRAVQVVGVVDDEPKLPRKWSRTVTCHFPLRVESIELDGVSCPADTLFQVSWAGAIPKYGDRVSLLSSAANLPPPRNPGEFDYAAHERRLGCYSELRARYAEDCRILAHDCGNPVRAWALAARRWMSAQLAANLDDSKEIATLVESLVLGLHGDTPEDFRDLLERTGTVHLFAVSGVNVAFLTAFLLFLLRLFQVSRRTSVFVVVPLLAGYALATGLGASTLRAVIMTSVLLAAALFDRPSVSYNSFAAAAFGLLAWDTNQLFSVGFQFSFGVVFVVIWLTRRLEARIAQFGGPDPFLPPALWNWRQRLQVRCAKAGAAMVGVSLVSFVASLPFTIGYFHIFSPVSALANVIAVPLAELMLAVGLCSLLTSLISPSFSILFNNANWMLAKWMLAVLQWFAQLPGGYAYVGPRLLPARAPFEITVLDLGDGGAVHVRAGAADWLIDCGHAYEYTHSVLPYLRYRGVNGLAGLILTEGNAQRIGGAISVLNDLAPAMLADSALKDRSAARRAWHAELAKRQLGKCILQRGDIVSLAPEIQLRVLFPPPELQKTAADDKALVLLLQTPGFRALFLANSGFATEEWLRQNEPDLQTDLLVKGQHAKDLSGTPDFLAHVHPQAIVCSEPKIGGGAALDAWAEQVRKQKIALFRQDQTGAVEITAGRGGWSASGYLNGQTFRSRAE